MVRLRRERYANENAHKLHPRAANPFQVRGKINANAYDIAIPPDSKIPSTFNICDLVPYRGRMKVPTEPGRPPDSTESSLLDPEEDDGSRSPRKGITADALTMNPDGKKPRGRRFHAVSRQNYSKLTNFTKFTRIEGYNGKYGSNPQGIKEFLYVIFKFDQIGREIDGRNWGKWYFKKVDFKSIPRNQKSSNLDLISWRNQNLK